MKTTDEHVLLEVQNLVKSFARPRSILQWVMRRPREVVNAINDVSLSVRRGETLGIVGESGCGKSTLARCLVRLHDVDSGRVTFGTENVLALKGADLQRYNRRVQLVFQDPYSSLNPRLTAGRMLREVIEVHKTRPASEIPARVDELLDLVGLPASSATRYPYEFSGGQRQRLGIARALAIEPECLIADEIVSALDVSIQAQIVNLLIDLQDQLNLTVLFVSHDLRVVRFISHRIAVIYLGSIVEIGDAERIFTKPLHPYTEALLAAAPSMQPGARREVSTASGDAPSPVRLPSGCPFHTRCPHAVERCRVEKPTPATVEDGRIVACHLHTPAYGKDGRNG